MESATSQNTCNLVSEAALNLRARSKLFHKTILRTFKLITPRSRRRGGCWFSADTGRWEMRVLYVYEYINGTRALCIIKRGVVAAQMALTKSDRRSRHSFFNPGSTSAPNLHLSEQLCVDHKFTRRNSFACASISSARAQWRPNILKTHQPTMCTFLYFDLK